MAKYFTLNDEKLDYAARLSGLLLNEGTDVLRWFLFDNLPRPIEAEPDLQKLLKDEKVPFQDILYDGRKSQKLRFSQEMFDILYPLNGATIDVGNMEISLLFLLIRYICKIMHPDWLWWDEDPGPHQKAPVFDVIRLAGFQKRMKDIVHNYQIDKEIYEKSFKYVSQIIERLRGYKSSGQRWNSDVIAYNDEERLKKERKPLTFLSIMRWQTLSVKERDGTYIVLKENFLKFRGDQGGTWEDFISRFGQMQYLEVCKINHIDNDEDDARGLEFPANDPQHRDYLNPAINTASALNWSFIMDVIWKNIAPVDFRVTSITHERPRNVQNCVSGLTSQEHTIYNSIDDTVFIEDPSEVPGLATEIRKRWKRKAIEQFSGVRVFPFRENDMIAMDDVTLNIRSDSGHFDCWRDVLVDSKGSFEQPTRICLIGPPSVGKTTTLRKISYQCATSDCPPFSTFDLIFYLDLACIPLEKPYVRMADCVKRQSMEEISGSESGISPDDIENLISSRRGKGVLFLLDNIDELNFSGEFYEIWDTIDSNIWPQCGIITTSKSYWDLRDRNSNDRISASGIETGGYRVCYIDGFNKFDVRKEVRRYFSAMSVTLSNENHVPLSRHICNLLRLYHRDVYEGYYGSPVLCSLLCTAFVQGAESNGEIPMSMEQALRNIFDGWLQTIDIGTSEFLRAVLQSSLEDTDLRFNSEYTNDLETMYNLGLTRKPCSNGIVKFTHPILQDYLSARVLCSSHDIVSLHLWVKTTADVMRLQNLLIFCCEDKMLAEGILDMLSKFVTQCQSDDKDMVVSVSMRCFHVIANKSGGLAGQCMITRALERLSNHASSDNEESDLICATLNLNSPSNLSHKAREAFLSFVAACKPGLTRSGTIFPLLRSVGRGQETPCIRDLHISDIRSRAANFVALLIAQLPFLNSLSLTQIMLESSDDFRIIIDSLIPSSQKVLSALTDLRISFRCETHFDVDKVPQYDVIARIFHELTFLEKFCIDPLTYQNFTSLFDETNIAVPIQTADLAHCGISEDRCPKLGDLLSRSIFLQYLNVSHNPIHGGLRYFLRAFANFRNLQVLQLEECCLSPQSVTVLAASFKATNVNQSLCVLSINGNHIDDQELLLEFASSLGNLRQLRTLDLSRNFLGDRVICVLASQLLDLSSLRQLKLDYVQMSKLGFSAIRSSMIELKNLEILSIGENPLPPDAMVFICDWTAPDYRVKQTIEEITLSGISSDLPLLVTRNAVRKTAESLTGLQRLRKLNLQNTALTHPDVMTILEAAEKHPCMEKITLTDSITSIGESERKAWSRLHFA